VKYGFLTKDIFQDLIAYIASSLNVYPIKNKYILYKRVQKKRKGVYVACYDGKTKYKDGELTIIKNPDMNKKVSCSHGIHVSTPFYWEQGDTLIAVEFDIKDIITCMEGKLRVKKVKTLGEVDKEIKKIREGKK